MHFARGVRKRRFNRAAVLFGALYGLAHVARVVERVENTDYIYAVLYRHFAEFVYHVVGVMLVAEQVLTAKQHLQFGVGQRFSEFAQSFPRVFVEITQARVEGCTAPSFERVVTYFIQLLARGKHFVYRHARCGLRLVRVAQYCFHDFDFCHNKFSLYCGYAYQGIASSTPAATALPITPATLGPIACIKR